jgi:hypothetical protein
MFAVEFKTVKLKEKVVPVWSITKNRVFSSLLPGHLEIEDADTLILV